MTAHKLRAIRNFAVDSSLLLDVSALLCHEVRRALGFASLFVGPLVYDVVDDFHFVHAASRSAFGGRGASDPGVTEDRA